MIFLRQTYLDKLISGRGNGLVKIVTGGRRCGKSFLLFTLFHDWLISRGVGKDHLIELSLDDMRSKELRDPVKLLDYIDSHINDDGQTHYVILDEVQLVGDFVEVLLSLMQPPTGSVCIGFELKVPLKGRGYRIPRPRKRDSCLASVIQRIL